MPLHMPSPNEVNRREFTSSPKLSQPIRSTSRRHSLATADPIYVSEPLVSQSPLLRTYQYTTNEPEERIITPYPSLLLKKNASEQFFKREQSLNPSLRSRNNEQEVIEEQEEEIKRLSKEKDRLRKELAVVRNNQKSFGTTSELTTIAKLREENRTMKQMLGVEHVPLRRSKSHSALSPKSSKLDVNKIRAINKKKFSHVRPKVDSNAVVVENYPVTVSYQNPASEIVEPVTYYRPAADYTIDPVTYVRPAVEYSTEPVTTIIRQPEYTVDPVSYPTYRRQPQYIVSDGALDNTVTYGTSVIRQAAPTYATSYTLPRESTAIRVVQ